MPIFYKINIFDNFPRFRDRVMSEPKNSSCDGRHSRLISGFFMPEMGFCGHMAGSRLIQYPAQGRGICLPSQAVLSSRPFYVYKVE